MPRTVVPTAAAAVAAVATQTQRETGRDRSADLAVTTSAGAAPVARDTAAAAGFPSGGASARGGGRQTSALATAGQSSFPYSSRRLAVAVAQAVTVTGSAIV